MPLAMKQRKRSPTGSPGEKAVPPPQPPLPATGASVTVAASPKNGQKKGEGNTEKAPHAAYGLTAFCVLILALAFAVAAFLSGRGTPSETLSAVVGNADWRYWSNLAFGSAHSAACCPCHNVSEGVNTSDPKAGWGKRKSSNARGVYPKGCKWRDVQYSSRKKGFWDIEEYEYWDEASRSWVPDLPPACIVPGVENPSNWAWKGDSPRTEVKCTPTHCIYEKLWYNNGRFYLLVDGPTPVSGWKMSRNQDLNVLHVNNASSFVDSLDFRVVTGDTLIFDFVFFLHPTAIGHWSEMMFPLFSILRGETDFSRPADQFMLLHLKRVHLMEWVRAVMGVALGVEANADLPPIIMQQEDPSVWTQIISPLEGYEKHEWVCFERALVVRDTFTGGNRTFQTREDAVAFRSLIYSHYDLPLRKAGDPVPRTITYQRKRANRRVLNEDRMLEMLREFGEVRVVEFNASTSFRTQVEEMSRTGVFISVHTSNLANAQFLAPGSAVVELLQRNWVWHNLDQSFLVQTQAMGDLHHFAWRARHRNQTVYINKRDGERFGDWTPIQCATEDCVEAHTNVDVIVNLGELRALLRDRLPLVFAGASVESARLPWPETGLPPEVNQAADASAIPAATPAE